MYAFINVYAHLTVYILEIFTCHHKGLDLQQKKVSTAPALSYLV